MASGPITSQLEREKMETAIDFIFLGSKITVDGDYHEMKRHLLLERKAMKNLDIIFKKSTDITLLTDLYCQSSVFPVVM